MNLYHYFGKSYTVLSLLTIALNILFAHEAEAAAEIKVLHLCTVPYTQMHCSYIIYNIMTI